MRPATCPRRRPECISQSSAFCEEWGAGQGGAGQRGEPIAHPAHEQPGKRTSPALTWPWAPRGGRQCDRGECEAWTGGGVEQAHAG